MAKATKKAKTEKKPRKVRGAKPATSTAAGSNAMDPDKRALFLKDKTDYAAAMTKLDKAQATVRALGKVIKGDGFTMRQIKLAIQLETPEGEAEFRSLIANDLIAAQYAGASVGSQLQLFLEPDRTPAVDMAYDEGMRDSMEAKAAKPGYAPSTPQYARYMEGYHDETERRVKAGIKSTDPKPSRAEVMQASREKNAAAEKLN
jgi:hypothetical protein